MKVHIPHNKIARVIERKEVSTNSLKSGKIQLCCRVPTIQCKYKWSKEGDDGVLIGEKYVIKLNGYTDGTLIYESYAKKLHLSIPNSMIIKCGHKLWPHVLEAIADVKNKYKNGETIEGITEALIMDKISGIPCYLDEEIEQVYSPKMSSIFFDIGKIIALDLFLRNYDRFNLSKYADRLGKSEYDDIGDSSWKIWNANLGNLIFDKMKKRIIPIDSDSYLFNDIMTSEYRENVYEILQEIDKKELYNIVLSSGVFNKFSEDYKREAAILIKNGLDYAKIYLFERRTRKPKEYYASKRQKINRQKELDRKMRIMDF